MCKGLGYQVNYEERLQSAATRVYLIPFVNAHSREGDKFTINANDSVSVAVYTDYDSISDFLEKEQTPSEFIKSFQPNGECISACEYFFVKPVRSLKSSGCYFVETGQNPATDRRVTDTASFQVRTFDISKENRENSLKSYEDCGLVQNNDDLENYYKQINESQCPNGMPKLFARKWLYVEVKASYQPPKYKLENFSEIIKSTTSTKITEIEQRSVRPFSTWGNQ